MKRRVFRPVAGITAIPLLLAVSVSPAYAFAPLRGDAGAALAGTAAPDQPVAAAQAAPGPCNDSAYSLLGGRWKQTLNWSYQSSSTPGELSASAALTVIKRSFKNITGARNDCGLADEVSATSNYNGQTSAKPSVTRRGRCGVRDGQNVVGFGSLPSGILAITCIRRGNNARITEADIRINSNYQWVLTLAACKPWHALLEPTMTHEIGHAFGLGHVGERRHGRLTMSTTSDGPCANGETSLGLGDWRGLRHLYPL
jgi:hypothetical protein